MITVFADGACEPKNPGGMGACAMIVFDGSVVGTKDGERPSPRFQSSRLIGSGPAMTNNIAEWRALRGTLLWLSKVNLGIPIQMFMDSQLVVKQFNRSWKCNSPEFQSIRDQCWGLKIHQFTLTWVPRAENWVADNLINQIYAKHGIKVTDWSKFKKSTIGKNHGQFHAK